MPLVQLTGAADGANTGQVIWVWSIHNPANTDGDAAGHRKEALRRQLATMTELAAHRHPRGDPGRLQRRQGRPAAPRTAPSPRAEQRLRRVGRARARSPRRTRRSTTSTAPTSPGPAPAVDNSTQTSKIADHPLVIATTAGSSAGCAVATARANYNLGPVKPQLTQLVNVLGPDVRHQDRRRLPRRAPPTPTATPPASPPTSWSLTHAGRAAPGRPARGLRQGPRQRARHRLHHLVPADLVRRPRLRGLAAHGGPRQRDREPPRPRPHQRQARRPRYEPVDLDGAACDEVVYPVPAQYVGTDNHNWHETGPLLVQLAHRHRLLRPVRNPRLRRPRRHHRDRHHPGLGRPAAGQGHHRRRAR